MGRRGQFKYQGRVRNNEEQVSLSGIQVTDIRANQGQTERKQIKTLVRPGTDTDGAKGFHENENDY